MQSPNFTINFFGFGNEALNFDDDFELNYNRVKARSFNFNPQLKWQSKSDVYLSWSVNHYSQKEAICFKNNDTLFIADEKVKKTGRNLFEVSLQSLK